ncbi:MAG: hypothetical protein FJ403_13985 [Verrucomicrobia bacterium]|nr:hypothetical protein [Verrucomicrobiota bacterium]
MPVRAAGALAVRDPLDIPFRRAPMGRSSRSIVVSLTTKIHLAFDARQLRTHTVWEGAPLNLYGPPSNGTATRFVCDFTGDLIWEDLSPQPWEFLRPGGSGFDTAKSRFLGVSTKGGQTSFLYEVVPSSGTTTHVRETPRLEQVLSGSAIVRRFEVAPLSDPLRYSPVYGVGEPLPLSGVETAAAIQREKNFLVVALRGLAANLTAHRDDGDHIVVRQSERDGKAPYSVVLTNIVSDPKTRIMLTLPRSVTEQMFEVATLICGDSTEAINLANAFAALPIKTPGASSHADGAKDTPTPQPKVLLADPAFVDKPAGDESFVVEHFPAPKEIKLLVGGLDALPNGDLAICTYAGEFQNASVMRVALEKVNGEWQGAVFPFVKGFASGVNRIAFGRDGKLYAGGLRMGHWTSIAPQPHSLDRVAFTGKTPFEIRDVHAQPDGFALTFTQPVDAKRYGELGCAAIHLRLRRPA